MKSADRRRLLSVDRAVGRYSRSLRQGMNLCRADGDADGQTANYRRSAERAELRAEQVKQVLCSFGVPPLQFLVYRNFALHLDKLIRMNSAETLRSLVRSAVDYWTACGLRPEVLSAICLQVFGLEL